MVAGLSRAASRSSLRHVLKQRTRRLHDELDGLLGHAPLDPIGYAHFLRVQHAARSPIESWASDGMPRDLRPPASAPLIAADLAALGAPLPAGVGFALPAGADPIGVAWALAGSSLGNRAMLLQRRKAGLTAPERFLGDPAPAQYFRELLPRLAAVAPAPIADGAVLAAEAVFETFLAAARAVERKAAA